MIVIQKIQSSTCVCLKPDLGAQHGCCVHKPYTLWSQLTIHLGVQVRAVAKAAMKYWNRLLPHQSLQPKMKKCLSSVVSPQCRELALYGTVWLLWLCCAYGIMRDLHKYSHPVKQILPKRMSLTSSFKLDLPVILFPSSAGVVLWVLTDALDSHPQREKNVPKCSVWTNSPPFFLRGCLDNFTFTSPNSLNISVSGTCSAAAAASFIQVRTLITGEWLRIRCVNFAAQASASQLTS